MSPRLSAPVSSPTIPDFTENSIVISHDALIPLDPPLNPNSNTEATCPNVNAIPSCANDSMEASIPARMSSRLAVFNNTKHNRKPSALVLGDSLVRHLILPGAITYCLSGGKIAEMIELAPTLVELHPTINFVILHVCTNDVMRKQSIQMQNDMESLCTTIESLGKRCVRPLSNSLQQNRAFQ